jgi:hypothetical protein
LLDFDPLTELHSSYISFVVLGTTVTEEFRKQHAATLRAMAEKADPFIKRRLLDLAARYDRAQRPPTAIQSISAEQAQ